MEEIKEKEYIRTDKGTIARIKDLEWDILYSVTEMKPKYKHWISKEQCYTEYIIKHSFDIKDLVQAGDLIKIPEGIYEVIFDESYEKLGILVPNKTCLSIKHSALEYIFSEYKNVEILTKEQFNQMKCIVGDE